MGIDYSWLEEEVVKRPLGESERAKLDRALVETNFSKQDKILTQGQAGGVLYILRTGRASISSNINGQEVHLATAGDGALFGEITFLTGDAATATVTADADCLVYKLERSDCAELMQSEPELVYAFMAYMLINAAKVIRSRDADHATMLQYMSSSHK